MAQAIAVRAGRPAVASNGAALLVLGVIALLATTADILVGTGAWFFAIAGLALLVAVILHPEIGIAVFLSTFLVTYPAALQGGSFLTINNMLGLLFLVLLVHRVYVSGDWSFLYHRELMWLTLIVAAYSASSVLNGPEPRLLSLLGPMDRNDSLRLFLNRAVFVLFFISFIRNEVHLRLIYLVALGLMVFGVAIGVRAVISGGGVSGYRAANWVVSTIGNPNRLAMAAIIALGSMFYMMRVVRSRVVQGLLVGLMLIMVLGVFMSASRSGLAALVACVSFIMIDEGFDLRKILSLALIGLIAVS
ncbi:MAG TPA: hypothetical protein VL403_20650, partial [Candidatus Kryptonia bacterium]|nr:hypothetical protein [Candidatus Kryptonia bacterium]